MKENSEEYRQDLQRRVKQEPLRLDSDGELWNKVLGEIEATEKPERRIPFYWYATAASLFIILTAGITYFYVNKKPEKTGNVIAHEIKKEEKELITNTEKTKIEKHSVKTNSEKKQSVDKAFKNDIFKTSNKAESFKLSDGSEITLNKSGGVNIKSLPDNNIEVKLSGEAFFEVAPGLKRTFRVYFGTSSLEVIGTRFSVRSIEQEGLQEVLVSEGIVKVTVKNSKEILLKKGSYLEIDKNTGTFEVKNVNPSHYLSWKTGSLNFSETPLPEVATVLSRVYRIKIEATNNIKSCTFTGDLSQMSLEEALKVIEVTTSAEIKRNADHVKISGAPCN